MRKASSNSVHCFGFSEGTNKIPCAPLVVKSEKSNLLSSFNCYSFSFLSPFKSQAFSSVDTLSVSVWFQWFHEQFFLDLDSKRELAQELDVDSVNVEFGSKIWNVHRFAPSYFRHHLSSGDIHIYFSAHKHDGRVANCKIDIGSLSCWAGGREIYEELICMITAHGCNHVKEIVGRVDVCQDQVGVDIKQLNVNDERYWICKATKFGIENEHRKLSYMRYGKGNTMLRIYDKTLELKQTKSTAKQIEFTKIWGLENYDDKPTTRTEFQFRRETLSQFSDEENQINTVSELYENLQSLWDYASRVWARHNSLPVDRDNKNQQRSQASPFWQKVVSVEWGVECLMKRSVSKGRKNLDALSEQMRGIVVTLVSSTGLDVDDYYGIMSKAQKFISDELNKYMTEDYHKFFHKYKQRQRETILAVDY